MINQSTMMKGNSTCLFIALILSQIAICYCIPYDDMNVNELWYYFGCDEIFEEPRPVHTLKDWLGMRDAYQAAVGLRRSSLTVSTGHGFSVDVEATQADEKGRGVFAVSPIKKGALVWSTKMTARFGRGSDYRRFLASIRDDLACDVLQWAYVQSLEFEDSETTKAFISVDLDDGSFINSYNLEEHEEGGPNIGCDPEVAKEFPGACKQNYFALRDIEEGEELLLDYSEFAIQEGWQWFGL
jgi:SET domain